jgi:hypothetical protein
MIRTWITIKVPCESAHVAVGSFYFRSSRPRVIGSLEPVTFIGLVFRTMVFNDDVLIFFYDRQGLGASVLPIIPDILGDGEES